MRILWLGSLIALLGLGCNIALAQEDSAPIRVLEPVVVTGVRAGPGLWQVRKGEHVLWILGFVAPVPNKMQWYAPQTEAVLRKTQEIIWPPGVSATLGFGGAFQAALALPAILRARKNPDGKTLKQVLPADLYQRWSGLKAVYLKGDDDIETWRPIFAAEVLYGAAIKRAGLTYDTGVGKRIDKLGAKYDIKRTSTMGKTRVKNPRALAKSFARAELDDVACFRSVLDRLEQDVTQAALKANAWAVGDLESLKRLQGTSKQPCFDTLAKTEAGQSMGIDAAVAASEQGWLAAADAALAKNDTSFAALPMGELLEPDGLLARLRSKGYVISEPRSAAP